MRKLILYCKTGALLCLFISLFTNCQDSDWLENTNSQNEAEVGLPVEEARAFFESQVISMATRSESKSNDYYAKQLMLPIGEIIPEWQKGKSTSAKYRNRGDHFSVDAPVQTPLRYRVIQTDPVTGKKRTVKAYHKMVVVKDSVTGKMGNFITYFIATNNYSRANKGIISEWFNNDGYMKDFSGLKIYTTLEGHILRVNQYVEGQKVKGIFLGGVTSQREYVRRLARALYLMRNMTIQQGTRMGVTTRWGGEDDDYWGWDDDYWGWNDNDWGWDDDDWGWNDNDWNDGGNGNDWNTGGDNWWDLGGGWWYDNNNDQIWYDWDDDGVPDSAWLPDVEVGGGRDPWYDNDPDPDPDWGYNDYDDDDDRWRDDYDDRDNNTPPPSSGNKTEDVTDKFYSSESTLTSADKTKLSNAVSELQKTNSTLNQMIKDLGDLKPQIKFTYDSSIEQARFNMTTGTIIFENSNAIKADFVREELVHAMQHYGIYGNEMTDKKTNFELEAKLFQDIACSLGPDGACPGIATVGMLDNQDYMSLYWQFMESYYDKNPGFTEEHERLYKEMGEKWDQYPGTFDKNIGPELLKKYFK